MESCSLNGWSSILVSRILSAPETEGEKNYTIFKDKTKPLPFPELAFQPPHLYSGYFSFVEYPSLSIQVQHRLRD